MKRILHIVTTMDFGGAETLLMSIYRNIDREKVQFDFLCHNRLECKFFDEINKLGGRMYMVRGPRHVGILNYFKELDDFFKKHPEYRTIHAHMNRDSSWALWRAKKAGIPNRIAHSHVANNPENLIRRIYTKIAKYTVSIFKTDAFACSIDAGKDLFGCNSKFHVLYNAIDVNNFQFNNLLRCKLRDSFNIQEKDFVIGHVGRFSNEKNHIFLLKLLQFIHNKNKAVKLLLVGGGELEEFIKTKVEEMGLKNDVIFAGQHTQLQSYYSAMDAFLFPSLFEGLGIVAVEAQCSGLPVFASDTVPRTAKITDLMEYISLNSPLENWATRIMNANSKTATERENYKEIVEKSAYNIANVAKELQDYYLSL